MKYLHAEIRIDVENEGIHVVFQWLPSNDLDILDLFATFQVDSLNRIRIFFVEAISIVVNRSAETKSRSIIGGLKEIN